MSNDAVTAARRACAPGGPVWPITVDERHILFRVDGGAVEVSPPLFHRLVGGLDDGHARPPSIEPTARRDRRRGGDEIGRLVSAGFFDVRGTSWQRHGASAARAQAGILILLTQQCNLRCAYCYASGGDYGGAAVAQRWAQVRTGIDQLIVASGRRRLLRVTFFGGEPLLAGGLLRQTVRYRSE